MRLSQYHIPTLKDVSSDVVVKSHELMLKSGMIRQIASGMYVFLPLGVRVLTKISNIIREEINKIGGMEAIFPLIQMNEVWIKSGRAAGYCGPETLRMKDRHEKDMLFSPTAEESAHLTFSMDVKSYKQLPMSLYQIHWKFRDEMRPRFGLMRCREFLMLDAYSFDLNEVDAKNTYNNYFKAYLNIFKRMGLLAVPMRAATGEIGGDLSHEFHILADTGESTIFYDKKLDEIEINDINVDEIQNIYAKTEDEHNEESCPVEKENLINKKGIEVGHIFYYADKYSKAMDIKIQNKEGKMVNPVGGAYGIGVTRIIAAAIEASYDKNGIIWPESISPFDIQLINLSPKDEKTTQKAEEIYQFLKQKGIDVLYDDTTDAVGIKLNKADLIGIPKQIIIGQRNFENGIIEIKTRKDNKTEQISINSLKKIINS